jgi:hypothetical protein
VLTEIIMGEEQQPGSGKGKGGLPEFSAMHIVIIIGVIVIAAIFVAKFGFGTDIISPSSGEMAIVKKVVTPDVPVTIRAPACGRFQTRCGNVCTDTLSDSDNCGSCGTVCPAENSTDRKCSGGKCVKPCRTGYIDCNKDMTDGCEVSFVNDANNCGGCGNVCGSGSCSFGQCSPPPISPGTPVGDGKTVPCSRPLCDVID